MADDSGTASGLALYFELRGNGADGMVLQTLVLQEMIAANGKITPFQLLSRVISEQNPKRSWRFTQDENFTSKATKTPKKTFDRTLTVTDAAAVGLGYLDGVIGAMDALLSSSWTPYREPLLLEVGPADVESIAAMDSPRALLDRLRRLRDSENFDALPGGSAGV